MQDILRSFGVAVAVVGSSLTKIAILYSRFTLRRGREETHPQRTIEIISLGSGLGSTKFCAMWERVGWFCQHDSVAWEHSRHSEREFVRICLPPDTITACSMETPRSVSQLSCLLHLGPYVSDSLVFLVCFIFYSLSALVSDGHSYGHCCSGLHFLGRVLGPGYYPVSLDLFCLAVESMENHQR